MEFNQSIIQCLDCGLLGVPNYAVDLGNFKYGKQACRSSYLERSAEPKVTDIRYKWLLNDE